MPIKIEHPSVIQAAGTKPKVIREFAGRVNTRSESVSIARMSSPSGWIEPGQRPQFDEYSLVLSGELHVTGEDGSVVVIRAGEAVIALAGEWVQYATPGPEGAEYVAVCVPAFSPDTVHRDPDL